MAVTDAITAWVREFVAGWVNPRFFPRQVHQQTSRGSSGNGLPIILNRDGKIDDSFIDGDLAIDSINVTRDLAAAATSTPVVAIVQDHASDDQAALSVQQDGTGDIISGFDGVTKVFAVSDGGTTTVAQTGTTGHAFAVTRNLASASTNSPLVTLVQDNAGDDQIALRVQQDGAGQILALYDGGTEVFSVIDGGGVGAGISVPVSRIHVYENTANTGYTAGALIEQDGSGDADLHFLLTGATAWTIGLDNSDSDLLKFSGSDALGTNNMMTLSTTGVGIGLASGAPSYPLDVQGSVDGDVRLRIANTYFNAASTNDTATLDFSFYYNNAASITPGALIQAYKTETWEFNGDTSAGLAFSTRSNGTVAQAMMIDPSGAVGIGVTTVGAVLGVKAGTSTNDFAPDGGLFDQSTSPANSSTGETTLATYSVPANTLATNGDSLYYEIVISYPANANAKTLRIKFGSQTILTATLGTLAGETIYKGRIIRTAAATQKFWVDGMITTSGGDSTGMDYGSTLTQTLSNANNFVVTGQGGATNDVVLHWVSLDYRPHNS
jgi:hypothetical protein